MASLPTVLKFASHRGGHAQLTLEMDPDLDVFKGHFPGTAIVPGVAQIHWAVHFGRELLTPAGVFSGAQALKFLRVILPPEQVWLSVEWDPAGRHLRFSYQHPNSSITYSSGTLLFTP